MEGLHGWYVDEALAGVVVMDVVVEDTGGREPDAADAASLQEGLELVEFQVVADVDQAWWADWSGTGGTSQHSYTVVGADGRVSWRKDDGGSTSLSTLTDEVLDAL